MDEAWQKLLRSVLPHLTSRRVGRLTDKSHRVAQKWFSGEMTVPLGVLGDVTRYRETLEYSGFTQKLDDVIAEAVRQGVHPEIIASHLAHHYKNVTGIEIE